MSQSDPLLPSRVQQSSCTCLVASVSSISISSLRLPTPSDQLSQQHSLHLAKEYPLRIPLTPIPIRMIVKDSKCSLQLYASYIFHHVGCFTMGPASLFRDCAVHGVRYAFRLPHDGCHQLSALLDTLLD